MPSTTLRARTWHSRTLLAVIAALALVEAQHLPASGGGGAGLAANDAKDDPAGADGGQHGGAEPEQTYQVTLVTGDVVQWQVLADGEAVASVDEAAADTAFQTIALDEDYYVIPSDVASLVGTTLDRDLFNIPALVEQGYHDAASDGVPVIVSGNGSFRSAVASGLTVDRALPSINGFAAEVKHNAATDVGNTLAEMARSARQKSVSASPNPTRIWLDRQVEVALDESVPRTGAPQAWDAGFDGTGATLAILDTGIDGAHPDVAGKVVAAQNFSSSEGTADRHGHGTHVAGIAAGSGAASGGARPGVAPGANLVVGKVLDDDGRGSSSDIIAGMEWAAIDQDADVINMSLGGEPTDGTDPVSQAVNSLTVEQDVLFVIAAGNSGPGERTVGTPATADAALTVGSVTKNGALASTSARGPRLGDSAIKPDITAPGVGIVAARAEGTSLGIPVDDLYTRASGTSMASPHVAGAATIVVQQHPDWDPATVKAALINASSSAQELTVYEQGGGELDVAEATNAQVVATPGTLNLGYFPYPHDDYQPVTETLSYTNYGTETITLDLTADIDDADGNAAPSGMVTIEPQTITIEPAASAEVSVTVDVAAGPESLYGGSVIATARGERVAHTPTGFHKEPEMYDITVQGIAADGRPAAADSVVDVIDVNDATAVREISNDFVNGMVTVRVPPGTYSVMGVITTFDEADGSYLNQAMMGDPEVEVTEDISLVWDAREATPITVDAGKAGRLQTHTMAYHRAAASEGRLIHSWNGGSWSYSAMSTEPITLGLFEFYSQFHMVDESADPVRFYDLMFPEPGAIPADLDYSGDENVAVLDSVYHGDDPDQAIARTRTAWRPYQTFVLAFRRTMSGPQRQIEVVSAGDTRWQQAVYAEAPRTGRLAEPVTYYEAGEQHEVSWFASPRTPALEEGTEHQPGALPVRDRDVLGLQIAEWSDAQVGAQRHVGLRESSLDSTAFRLYEDGNLTAKAERARGDFAVSPGPSRLRMELDVAREADWWQTSIQTHTAWEFDSSSTEAATPLPLLQVDYDIDLGLTNMAPTPAGLDRPATIGLHVRHPQGVDGAAIAGARAWVSYDDGGQWKVRPVRATGEDSFDVILDRRDGGGGHASIRVEVWDADGNTVEQEIIRAYALGVR